MFEINLSDITASLPETVDGLLKLEMDLPRKGQFVYDFANDLVVEIMKKRRSNKLNVLMTVSMVTKLLKKYNQIQVEDFKRNREIPVAILIMENLEDILSKTSGTLFAKVVCLKIKEDDDLRSLILSRVKYLTH